MKFKVGDKLRVVSAPDIKLWVDSVTPFSVKVRHLGGFQNEYLHEWVEPDPHPEPDEAYSGAGSLVAPFITPITYQPIPTEQEKPVEQVYEVGGTLTLPEAIEAAKRGEIVESVTQGGKVHWHDKCLRWTTQNEPVSCSEANLTGWRVVPKLVPMTRELQEALEALLAAKLVSGPLATDTAFGRLALSACDFYQKAKESAK